MTKSHSSEETLHEPKQVHFLRDSFDVTHVNGERGPMTIEYRPAPHTFIGCTQPKFHSNEY